MVKIAVCDDEKELREMTAAREEFRKYHSHDL